MRWKDLKHIPTTGDSDAILTIDLDNMFLVGMTYNGHWTNPVFELFAASKGGDATHVHVYKIRGRDGQTTAQAILRRLPDTIVSYSYKKRDPDQFWNSRCVGCGVERYKCFC